MIPDIHFNVTNAKKDGSLLAYWFVVSADTLEAVEVDVRPLAKELDADLDALATGADCPHWLIRELAEAHDVTPDELPAVGGYANLDELVANEPAIPATVTEEYYWLCPICRVDICTDLLNRLPRPLVWLAENGLRG